MKRLVLKDLVDSVPKSNLRQEPLSVSLPEERCSFAEGYLNRRGPIFQLCFFHQQMQKLQLNPELQALDVDYVKTAFLWPATSSPGGIR
jgi:hypothetical protein